MTVRYTADHLIPMGSRLEVHAPGFVDVAAGRVRASGPLADAPGLPEGCQTISVDGALLPGFVNDHAHSPMTVLRGAGDGLPLDRWLNEVIWPRESRLTPDDVEIGMMVGAAEMLRNGITTTNEMYFFPEAVASGALRAGMRAIVGAAVVDGLERFGKPEDQIADALALQARHSADDLIDVALAPHSAYALADAPLQMIRDAALAGDLLVHIHVAETRHEGDGVTARTGLTVPEHLAAIGVLACRTLAAHCVWLTEADISLFAGSGVGVAHCPGSNGKIASGIAPVRRMREAGIPVGASTDGPASNDNLDVLEEARLALLYSRLLEEDAGALAVEDALRMITSEAARALGRSDVGSLTPGCWADMVRIDLDHPEYEPIEDPFDLVARIIWAGAARDVADVWVAGQPVVMGGRVMTFDVAGARNRARRIAGRIAG